MQIAFGICTAFVCTVFLEASAANAFSFRELGSHLWGRKVQLGYKCCHPYLVLASDGQGCSLSYSDIAGEQFYTTRDKDGNEIAISHCTSKGYLAVKTTNGKLHSHSYFFPDLEASGAQPKDRELEASMTQYANRVYSYLGPIAKITDGATAQWVIERSFHTNPVDGAIMLTRDEYLGLVEEHFIRPTWQGKQFGNCAEGARIGYCLAHLAQYSDITMCTSSHDHIFAAYLHPESQEMCVLDRWDVGFGHHFCGVAIREGRLFANEMASSHPWYDELTCEDPLGITRARYSGWGTFDGPTWSQSE